MGVGVAVSGGFRGSKCFERDSRVTTEMWQREEKKGQKETFR